MMRLLFLLINCLVALVAYPQFPVPCGDPTGASGSFGDGVDITINASSAFAAMTQFNNDMATFDGGLDCAKCPDDQEGCDKKHDNSWSFSFLYNRGNGYWLFTGVDLDWSLTCTACTDKDKSDDIVPFRQSPNEGTSLGEGVVPVPIMRGSVGVDETIPTMKAHDSGDVDCGTTKNSWFKRRSIGFTLSPGTGGLGAFTAIENMIKGIEWCEGCPPNETGCDQDVDFDPNDVTFSKLVFRGTYSNGDESWHMSDLEATFDVTCSACVSIGGDSIPPDSIDDFRLQSTQGFKEMYSLSSYPNPVENMLNLEFTGVNQKDLSGRQVEVFNMNGQLLLNCVDCDDIDVSSLPAGIYSLRAQLKNGQLATAKFHKSE